MTALVDIKEQARGRWPGILAAFGIDKELLDGEHRPCPVCNGKDRFRFDDRSGNGDWVCSGHGQRRGSSVGSGNGVDLLMGYLNKEFRDVVNDVRSVIFGGELPKVDRPAVVVTPTDRHKVLESCNKVLAKSLPVQMGSPVDRYLKLRGLAYGATPTLRYVPNLGYYKPGKENPELVGRFPAMIAPIVDVNNQLLGLHRTWLAPRGEGKAPVDEPKKLSNKGCAGGAIRLFDPVDGFIAITEGIETALAVNELYGWPVWATIATAFMEAVELPKEINKVVICADYDEVDANTGVRPGHKAAIALRDRLLKEGRQVKIMLPAREGMDFNDTLNERNAVGK